MDEMKESTETPDSMKVLYIEDNEHNIYLMQEMVSLIPSIDLEIAQTGVAGIRAIERLQPSLVLLDINLGDMSGYEVLRRVRSSAETASISFIAVTAGVMPEDLGKMQAANFDAVILKPIRFANLESTLRSFIEI